ncbi:Amino acid transporter [Olea europaea subsp. europaea]|uniref:Amino acid transporter n=1 Tax=Olea europaea subsp. europaea TaxID=158383 RepID=A0A8S0S243_OLEEU|nr:Amino acid transporter [Olea europaea subsp. europaea]
MMDFNHMIPSSSFVAKSRGIPKLTSPSWTRCHQRSIKISFNSGIRNYWGPAYGHSHSGRQQTHNWKFSAKKRMKFCVVVKLSEEQVKISKEKGSIAGAVALIIGTSIGSGILALPKKTSAAANGGYTYFILVMEKMFPVIVRVESKPAPSSSLITLDLFVVLCAYLGGDLRRVRTSVLLGSVVPLVALLVWNAIALGLSSQANEVADPVELLMSVRWSGLSFMVEAFSLLAVGTSLIGTILGFSEFFKEQLNNLFLLPPSTRLLEHKSNSLYYWWRRNKTNVIATAMVIAPSLFVSTTVPDAFSAATDIAGGYCMTMLYGVLPPAMAWAMNKKDVQGADPTAISRAEPALVGVGLFACGIVVEQILQDLSMLHS